MMSEMVERVAEAIWNTETAAPEGHEYVPWERLDDGIKDHVLLLARAAIKAMMEPTGRMLVRGSEPPNRTDDGKIVLYSDNVAAIYQAMLTAALED